MNENIKNRIIIGKKGQNLGVHPSVILVNPKYGHNVGAALRACSCFGLKQLWYTGNRIKLEDNKRLPREERFKRYQDVDLVQYDYPFDQFKNVVPIALEITPGVEMLPQFEHPENAVYVFGPEDGSIPGAMLRHCHRFVMIPTKHCTNLAAAVYITLYDRLIKRQQLGLEPIAPACDVLNETRGFMD